MRITFDLPANLDERLRHAIPNLDDSAKETFLVNLYRQGHLFHSEFAKALGLSRNDADGVLMRYGVFLDISPDEHALQVQQLDRLLGS